LKEVAGLAASLGLEGKTEIEKIRIIENFMKTEFSVTQQAESLTLEEMARQKKGSGPGTVHMFMELFKSQGIEYSFGFISDRYNTQFNPEIESVFFMQNYIFHFPKIDLYLAPLDFSSRLGYINYQWVPNHALLYTQYENPYPITTKIVRPVPQVNAANNFDSTVIRIVINDAMDDAEVHIERHLFGYDAGEYQTSYPLMNHSRKEEAHSELLNVFKDQSVYLLTEIQNVDFSDAFYKPIIVKGKITHLNTPLLEIAGKKHIFKLGNVFGDYLDVNELSDKKSDFVFGNAFTLNTTIIVEFPREIKMGNEFSVPVSADITGNEDILIQTTLTHKGNTIVFTKREQYRRHRYTSHEKEQVLDAFRFYNQLAKSALIIE
jgi:hypothetical protein